MNNPMTGLDELWHKLESASESQRLDVLVELAVALINLGDPDMHGIAAEACEQAIETERYDLAFEVTAPLSTFLLGQGANEKARDVIEKVLPFTSFVSDMDVAGAHWNYGAAFFGMGELLRAAEEFERAAESYGDQNDYGLAAVKRVLARCLAELKEYESAKTVYEESAAIFSSLGEMQLVASVRREFGEFLVNICQYRDAREQLSDAQLLYSFMGKEGHARSCSVNLGRALVGLHRLDEARVLFADVMKHLDGNAQLHEAALAKYYNAMADVKEFGPYETADQFHEIARILVSVNEPKLAKDARRRTAPGEHKGKGFDPWSSELFEDEESDAVDAELQAPLVIDDRELSEDDGEPLGD